MRDIGKNIRAARIRRGLTQDELAERLHVSRQTVSNYETGRSRPDVDTLLSTAEQLGVDIQVLLYGESIPSERRREHRLLLAEGATLLVLGTVLLCLGRWIRQFQGRFFILAPQYLTRLIAVPLFWLLLGWTLLRACGIFLRAQPLDRRWARPLRRAVLGCLTAWAVLQIPTVAEAICEIAYVLNRKPGIESAYSSASIFPRVWSRVSFETYDIAARFPEAFAVLGGALWLSKERPETAM